MTAVNYNTETLVGGEIKTDHAKLGADTYYKGMPLQYNFTVPTEGTADAGNTGDGTMTVVSQGVGAGLKIGSYEVECVEAVTNGGIFKLTDPDSGILATQIEMFAGAGEVSVIAEGGLVFSLTDGATDFIVGDKFTLVVTAGSYGYLGAGILGGFFFETNSKVLASAGYGSIIIGGEIQQGGIVDDSNAALTITDDMVEAWANLGFYIKRGN